MLAVIPAKLSSKRVPCKNLQRIGHKTLLQHTLDFALACGLSPVVTTDHPYIVRLYPRYAFLSTLHDKGSIGLWQEAVQDPIPSVYLEPSSPMRTPTDVRRCLHHPLAFTATPVKIFRHGSFVWAVTPNGACYASTNILDIHDFSTAQPIATPFRLNIDTPFDLALARTLYR